MNVNKLSLNKIFSHVQDDIILYLSFVNIIQQMK